jgi:hypothetical protein
VRTSLVTRVLKCIAILGPHSGCGSDVKIGIERLGYGDMPDDVTTAEWNGVHNHMRSTFSLHKCPTGLTAYRCNFDYDYWFGINGESANKIAACAGQ